MKVLYIIGKKEFNSTFVKQDYYILKNAGVKVRLRLVAKPLRQPIEFFISLIKDVKLARRSDLIFTWWLTSWYPALISVLSRKPLIVVSGGFDTVNDKKLCYGALYEKRLRRFVNFVSKVASIIIVVDLSLKKQLEKGLKKRISNIIEIPTGFDGKKWKLGLNRENYIITVSINRNGSRVRHLVKGIDRFVELARRFPNYKFGLIGYTVNSIRKLEKNIPNNLEIIPPINQNKLSDIYKKAHIYCQLSRHEGLPNSLAEAILCGCIAIGSNVNGIPKLIKPPGFIFDFDTQNIDEFYKQFTDLIKKEIPLSIRKQNREYILENFSIKKRSERLLNLMKKIITKVHKN